MRILLALPLLTGCFSDPPPAAGDDTGSESGTSSDPSSSSAATSSASTQGTSTSVGGSEDASETGVCAPQVFGDVEITHQPVNLFVLVLPSVDPDVFSMLDPGLLDGLVGADAEDLRLVFADNGTALPPVSAADLCTSCAMPAMCESAMHYTLTGASFAFELFTTAAGNAFACVVHPADAAPRGRVLVVATLADEIVGADLDTLNTLIDAKAPAEIDLVCSGCSAAGASLVEQAIAGNGGFVYDLDDPVQFVEALFRAALAPPQCLWPVMEDVAPPLTLADLRVTIDGCGEERPCPTELEQVTGAGACDGAPVIPQFFVTPDLFAPGVSAVTLCPSACAGVGRAAAATMTVEHQYVCP